MPSVKVVVCFKVGRETYQIIKDQAVHAKALGLFVDEAVQAYVAGTKTANPGQEALAALPTEAE